jgi:glyoxylase-like metal-dependent hydrolase (beta-lactamase superfamily II)
MSSSNTEKLPIPEYSEVPLALVADGVTGLRTLFVNVFGITSGPGGWVLVDSGLPFSANRIASWAGKQFGRPPSAIVQTHGHFDHTGALQELVDRWNIPVYAHPDEAPYLTGKSQYPPPDSTVDNGLFSMMSPLLPRGPVDVSKHLRPLVGSGELANLPGWKWIHTPGHTAGHISLFRPQDRTLIVGDAFCTTDQSSFLAVAQQKPELHGPPPYFTPDWDSAKASVEKLAALRPRVLAPGHGQPIAGADVEHRLEKLARDFDRVARPEKYRTAR